MWNKKYVLYHLIVFLSTGRIAAQPILETGGHNMPNEWIDQETHHKIIRLTGQPGDNMGFYFHNNPFVDNKMVSTLQIEQLTHHAAAMNGEIVSTVRKEVFYQVMDSVFSVNIYTKKETLIYVFPDDFKANITCINADGTLLAGAKSSDQEKELFKSNAC